MPHRQPGDRVDALIVFADIVDSSKYSAVLGYREYAKRLLYFQETFRSLGRRYFPEAADKAVDFSHVEARGDEGTVFVGSPKGKRGATRGELVFRAIEFLYHLKGRLRFDTVSETAEDAPRRFDIGAGIHWGPVMLMLSQQNYRLIIDGVEGFAINYGKRVESCSREGRYSRILLSAEAARFLEFKPVLLSSVRAPMKGIEDDVELYEVEAGLFDAMELRQGDTADERLVEELEGLCVNPMLIDGPWIKALAISVLERAYLNSCVVAEKRKYRKLQYDLAWHSPKEDDPILLYLRSRECRERNERTRELRYLRRLLGKYPYFVPARLLMVKACSVIARGKAEREEKLFARDTAREFLDRYSEFLNAEEKRDFRKLLRELAGRGTAQKKKRRPSK